MIGVLLLIGYSSDRTSSFILILLPASNMIRKIKKKVVMGRSECGMVLGYLCEPVEVSSEQASEVFVINEIVFPQKLDACQDISKNITISEQNS